MLQAIRDTAKGWIAWVVIISISIPFIFLGVQEYLQDNISRKKVIVARVNSAMLTQSELNNAVNSYRLALHRTFGKNLPKDILLNEARLRKLVLNALIEESLLIQHANKIGLRSHNKIVRSEILATSVFLRNGVFNYNIYRRMLAERGKSSADFEEYLRYLISTRLLRYGIQDTALTTDAEIEELVRLRDQKRNISYLTIPLRNYIDQVNITEDEIQAFYATNSHAFLQADRVKVQYLELNKNILAPSIPINIETITAYYKNNSKQFINPERRSVNHILFAVHNEEDHLKKLSLAKKVLAELHDGTHFSELAKYYSDDLISAKAGGSLGFIERGFMTKSLEKIAFTLNKGELSNIIQTPLGYHIIQVTEIDKNSIKPLNKVRDEIVHILQLKAAGDQFHNYVERLADLTFNNSSSLMPAAENLNLEIKRSSWIARDDLNLDSKDLLKNRYVIEEAFSKDVLEHGFNSGVIEIAPEHVIVVRVLEYEKEKVKPINEVFDIIYGILEKDAISKLMNTHTEEILNLIINRFPLHEIADQYSLKLNDNIEINRLNNSIPMEIQVNAYKIANGKAGTAILPTGDHVVILVKNITDGDTSTLSLKQREIMRRQISEARGNIELDSYLKWLYATNEIEIMEVPK